VLQKNPDTGSESLDEEDFFPKRAGITTDDDEEDVMFKLNEMLNGNGGKINLDGKPKPRVSKANPAQKNKRVTVGKMWGDITHARCIKAAATHFRAAEYDTPAVCAEAREVIRFNFDSFMKNAGGVFGKGEDAYSLAKLSEKQPYKKAGEVQVDSFIDEILAVATRKSTDASASDVGDEAEKDKDSSASSLNDEIKDIYSKKTKLVQWLLNTLTQNSKQMDMDSQMEEMMRQARHEENKPKATPKKPRRSKKSNPDDDDGETVELKDEL